MNSLQHYDRYNYDTCWQYHDEQRNAVFDKAYNDDAEELEEIQCEKVRKECKNIWEMQRNVKEESKAIPMACSRPAVKKCYNENCNYEVNWQWALEKNYCAGDRCVEELVPGVNHQLKMNCIRMELKRYWENIERQLDDDETFDSPTSVKDCQVEEEAMFPMDLNEMDLYCDEKLLFSLEELECDSVLN